MLDLKKHWDKKIEDLSLEKEKLLNKLHELDVEKEDFEDAPWNLQLVKKIQTIVNTNYVSTKPELVGVDIDSMSVDMKYLNTEETHPLKTDQVNFLTIYQLEKWVEGLLI